MKLSETEYFFFEWLIIQKQFTEDQFKNLSQDELDTLKMNLVCGIRRYNKFPLLSYVL